MSKIEVHPTRQRKQHGKVVREQRAVLDERTGKVRGYEDGYRVKDQLVLDRYMVREEITRLQWRAGDRFRQDWTLSGMEPRLTRDPGAEFVGGGNEHGTMATSERQLDARLSWRRACKTLGRHLYPVAIAVCCEDMTATAWAAKVGASSKQAPVVGLASLRIALSTLADEYQLDKVLDTGCTLRA